MKILVACKAIEDEIKAALSRLDLEYETVWLEGGLHAWPNRLRAHLQQVMDEADQKCDTLIFALGYCGGAMSDLNTGNYTTVIFLADDCLSVLLGSLEARIGHSRPVTYFMTAGWLRYYETNRDESFKKIVEKFGQAKADHLRRMMLVNYERIGLVDTGCYDFASTAAQVALLGEKWGLAVESLPGDSSWLEAFLTGPWDDPTRFLVIPPQSKICFDHWNPLLQQVVAVTPK